jgi:hypothetical protein
VSDISTQASEQVSLIIRHADGSTEGVPRDDLRYRCRNPHCRMKLPAPVENEHRAFCCRGCFEAFYRSRCRVCERGITADPMTGKKRTPNQNRKFCGRKCKAEAARFPHIFTWELPTPTNLSTRSRSAHSTDLKIGLGGDRPRRIDPDGVTRSLRCLRGCRWGGDPDHSDHSLYDKDGLVIARLVLEGDGHYHLRSPATWPRMSWPDLDEAKRRAESLALSMPLDSRAASRRGAR